MNKFSDTFVVKFIPVAVTLLLIANHAYVELPSATVATKVMAIAAASCFLKDLTVILLSSFFKNSASVFAER